MKTQLQIKLNYSYIFKDKPSIRELLQKIDKQESLKFLVTLQKTALVLTITPRQESIFVVNSWLEGCSRELLKALKDYYDQMQYEYGELPVIIHRYSTLRLIDLILSVECKDEAAKPIYDQQSNREDLFRLYLLINEEISVRQDNVKERFRAFSDDKNTIRFHLFAGLAHIRKDSSLFLPAFFHIQVMKLFIFEKWLRKHDEHYKLSVDYLKSFGIDGWNKYFQDLFVINKVMIQTPIILVGDYPNQVATLSYLSNREVVESKWNDLLNIKRYPLYKYSDNVFLLLDTEFLFYKFFSGLYHDLKELCTETNNTKFGHDFNTDFMERHLLNEVLRNTFGKNYLQFSESEIKAIKYKNINNLALPDYYVRNGNKVFLFECKNSFVSGELIASQRFDDIENDIKKKFYFDRERRKKRAIVQLLNFVNNKETGCYDFFDQKKQAGKLRYYPIIVVTDQILTSIGFNELFNEYLNIEKEEIEQDLMKRIKPLTIIHIDDFLYFDEDLKKLDIIIDRYHQYISRSKGFDKTISFSEYLATIEFKNQKKINKRIFEKYIQGSFLPKGN